MSDKMQEEFEAWAESDGYDLDVSDDERFTYAFHETECAWYGWQASRAALRVELSDMTNNGYEGFYPERVVKAALDTAGVRYK